MRITFSCEGLKTFPMIMAILEKNFLESDDILVSTPRVGNFSSTKNSISKFERKEGGSK